MFLYKSYSKLIAAFLFFVVGSYSCYGQDLSTVLGFTPSDTKFAEQTNCITDQGIVSVQDDENEDGLNQFFTNYRLSENRTIFGCTGSDIMLVNQFKGGTFIYVVINGSIYPKEELPYGFNVKYDVDINGERQNGIEIDNITKEMDGSVITFGYANIEPPHSLAQISTTLRINDSEETSFPLWDLLFPQTLTDSATFQIMPLPSGGYVMNNIEAYKQFDNFDIENNNGLVECNDDKCYLYDLSQTKLTPNVKYPVFGFVFHHVEKTDTPYLLQQ